jgi:transcription elongation factor Elf1
MHFECPHCGNNSFRIVMEHVDAQHAECIRCGEITPFAVSQMTKADDGERLAKTRRSSPRHRAEHG